MNSNAHETWLLELIGTDSMRTAAQKTEYAQTTISRQLTRGRLSPEMVISLCRAYDRSPVQGLVETGYINEFEVDGPGILVALREATNEQLLEEILRRSDPQARHLFGNDGTEDVIGLRPDFRVVSDPAATNDGGDDDGTVEEFDWTEPHAADSSINESEARIERGEDPVD